MLGIRWLVEIYILSKAATFLAPTELLSSEKKTTKKKWGDKKIFRENLQWPVTPQLHESFKLTFREIVAWEVPRNTPPSSRPRRVCKTRRGCPQSLILSDAALRLMGVTRGGRRERERFMPIIITDQSSKNSENVKHLLVNNQTQACVGTAFRKSFTKPRFHAPKKLVQRCVSKNRFLRPILAASLLRLLISALDHSHR